MDKSECETLNIVSGLSVYKGLQTSRVNSGVYCVCRIHCVYSCIHTAQCIVCTECTVYSVHAIPGTLYTILSVLL